MDAVDAPGIRAAALALVLAAVHPAARESCEEIVFIRRAERGQGFFEDALGLLVGVRRFRSRDNRHVEVIHVDGVELQQLFS